MIRKTPATKTRSLVLATWIEAKVSPIAAAKIPRRTNTKEKPAKITHTATKDRREKPTPRRPGRYLAETHTKQRRKPQKKQNPKTKRHSTK